MRIWSSIIATIALLLGALGTIDAEPLSPATQSKKQLPKNQSSLGVSRSAPERHQYGSGGIILPAPPFTPTRPSLPQSSRAPGFIIIHPNEGGVVVGRTQNVQEISCGKTCVTAIPKGATIRLRAIQNPGYRFKQWSGCEPTQPQECELVIQNTGTHVYVDFEKIPPPALTGISNFEGLIRLTWEYTGFQNVGELSGPNDGYLIEESNISGTTGWVQIEHFRGRESTRSLDITRPTGTYWYRVRAQHHTSNYFSPYSNVLNIQVNVETKPEKLRIINDLYDQTAEEFPGACEIDLSTGRTRGVCNKWGLWNTIIRTRIGPTEQSVVNSTQYERLWPTDSTSNAQNTLQILPKHDQDSSYAEFDVSEFTSEYWIYIQTGYWDFDAYTTQWEKHPTLVVGCDGTTAYKWALIRVTQPFGDPEIIRASNFLPDGNWQCSQFCPPCPP